MRIRGWVGALAGAGVVLLVACSQGLDVKVAVPVRDSTAISPGKRAYESLMVLPPKGSERGEASELAALERALLKRGVRIISSGVTGRVVVEETESGKTTQGATGLSDLERALVLAKKSNADALLQVAELKWEEGARYFVPRGGPGLDETRSREEFLAASENQRYAVYSPKLVFVGKLIDVETGEVVASVDMSRSVGDAVAPANYKGNSRELKTDSSVVREKLVQEIMDRLSELVSSGEKRSRTAAPAPAAPATVTPPASASASAEPPPKKKGK